MMFLIDNNIAFLPEQQVLKNTGTGTEAGLNLVATQLLVYLLQHADRVCGRDELLDAVFTRHNSSASDGNLNRHIMVLRRAFTDVHCDAEVIITVPRNGFKIGNVPVRPTAPGTETEGAPENNATAAHPPAPEIIPTPERQAEKKVSRRYTILFFLSFFFCLAAAGYYFLAPEPRISRPDVSVFKTEPYLKCEITYTRGTRYFPPAEVISELTRQGETVNCREPVKITLWRNDTPTQAWRFTTLCDSLKKCRGIYVYTQK
ncbi:winged helix-turn-helix domain-containing protein [Enterobacter cloacae]|uniref:winged helix-turn-helix domain-containing protein n=1 Tax=Enterobacter cloacae TaxID=550 RepID=UPI00129EE85F|nr:winged helix-turn-helix domain-containing protein [Enterobacter cloacae]MDA2942151.1 winged helix-turn-helix domain-containing protein [Enterobacter cloacae]MRM10909.1 hypothetical protein [Enterobacter cloacae subsp. dissolvens]